MPLPSGSEPCAGHGWQRLQARRCGRRLMRPWLQSEASSSPPAYSSMDGLSECSRKRGVNKLRYALSSPLPLCRSA